MRLSTYEQDRQQEFEDFHCPSLRCQIAAGVVLIAAVQATSDTTDLIGPEIQRVLRHCENLGATDDHDAVAAD